MSSTILTRFQCYVASWTSAWVQELRYEAPSSTTKRATWELYLHAAATSEIKAVAYSTFTQLWRRFLPNVVVMKPMSDLCWVCQQNSSAIMRAANRPEEEKSLVSACVNAKRNVYTSLEGVH